MRPDVRLRTVARYATSTRWLLFRGEFIFPFDGAWHSGLCLLFDELSLNSAITYSSIVKTNNWILLHFSDRLSTYDLNQGCFLGPRRRHYGRFITLRFSSTDGNRRKPRGHLSRTAITSLSTQF